MGTRQAGAKPFHILLTRPQRESLLLKDQLEPGPYHLSIDPMLTIAPLSWDVSVVERSAGCILTSQHAARALLHARGDHRSAPIFAVGEGTARPLREAGFANLYQADGTAAGLFDLIQRCWKPNKGPLVYLSGTHISMPLDSLLQERGLSAIRIPVYDAIAARRISFATACAISAGDIDAVIFLSKRTAQTFSHLCREANLETKLSSITAICMSNNVASSLERGRWRSIDIASSCSEASIVAATRDFLSKYVGYKGAI